MSKDKPKSMLTKMFAPWSDSYDLSFRIKTKLDLVN